MVFFESSFVQWKLQTPLFKEKYENDQLKNKTIITRGPHGCEYHGKIYPTKQVPVKDVSGAGDTFLAGLVVEFIKSNDIISAINFAQECTTIVVQKPGVSTIKDSAPRENSSTCLVVCLPLFNFFDKSATGIDLPGIK